MDAQDELLSAAVEITRAASGLAAQRFLDGVPASTKADGTEVTPADSEVEQLVRSLIATRFPGDGYEDIAPIPLIITEAGGRVSDLDGNDALSGNGTVLASNGHIHDALLDLVRALPPGRDYQALVQARR